MAITSSGIGSGLDVEGIITKLMQVEQRPLVALANREAQFTSQLSTLGTIKGAVSSFQTAAGALKTAASSAAYKFSSSDANSVSGSASPTGAAGTYSVTVTQLAQAQRLVAAGQASTSASIGDGTSTTLTLGFGTIAGGTLNSTNGTYSGATFAADPQRPPVQIQIDGTHNTLEGIRDAINASNAGVTASIVNDGSASPYRLTITSNTTGATSSLKITVAGSAGIATLLANDPAGTQNLRQTQTALDAQLSISGIAISRPTNTVTDAIQGVTLKLSNLASNVAVTVARDSTTITAALKGLVDAYNDANKSIKSATALKAILQGDTSTVNILSRLRSSLGSVLSASDGSAIASLSQLGVRFQKDGSLQFDSTKAQGAIDANPAGVLAAATAFGNSLSTLSDSLVGTGGALQTRTDGINNSIKDLTRQSDTISRRLVDVEKRYRTQFTALDVLMSNMQQTSNFLTQQLANLNKTSA